MNIPTSEQNLFPKSGTELWLGTGMKKPQLSGKKGWRFGGRMGDRDIAYLETPKTKWKKKSSFLKKTLVLPSNPQHLWPIEKLDSLHSKHSLFHVAIIKYWGWGGRWNNSLLSVKIAWFPEMKYKDWLLAIVCHFIFILFLWILKLLLQLVITFVTGSWIECRMTISNKKYFNSIHSS